MKKGGNTNMGGGYSTKPTENSNYGQSYGSQDTSKGPPKTSSSSYPTNIQQDNLNRPNDPTSNTRTTRSQTGYQSNPGAQSKVPEYNRDNKPSVFEPTANQQTRPGATSKGSGKTNVTESNQYRYNPTPNRGDGEVAKVRPSAYDAKSKAKASRVFVEKCNKFTAESSLMVAKSPEIIKELKRKYPTIAALLDHNRKSMLDLLRQEVALQAKKIIPKINIQFAGNSNTEDNWLRLQKFVEHSIGEIVSNETGSCACILDSMQQSLTQFIMDEYIKVLPKWPAVRDKNLEKINMGLVDSYAHRVYEVLWSCNGMLTAEDTRPQSDTFSTVITGGPDINVMIIDSNRCEELEKYLKRNGIEMNKQMVDNYSLGQSNSMGDDGFK